MRPSTLERSAVERASRSIRCLPFRRLFYEKIAKSSINSKELVETKDWEKLVFVPFGMARAEEHFEWMIKLGIIRRVVDGQGLTDRIKITPLGSAVIEQWKGEIPRADIKERIKETFRRHGFRA